MQPKLFPPPVGLGGGGGGAPRRSSARGVAVDCVGRGYHICWRWLARHMASRSSEGMPSRSFVIGTIAYSLGKKAEESKSHEWTVYLRAANPEEDMSTYVKKVVFHLHPTLQPPSRTVEQGPFEVTEQGWGEFEIQLQVYFHDSREKPIDLATMLKLYPDGDANAPQNPAKPVVSERYDEFVFSNPSDALRQRLAADIVPNGRGWKSSPHARWFGDHDGNAQEASLQQMHQQITAELQNASKRRRLLEDELKHLRGEAD